jgi:hypothetical protein
MSDIISETFKKLKGLFGDIEDNLDLFPPVVADFLLIHAAQGIIDNGGYRYFFGSDWPGKPPCSRFIDAYRAIGCEKQARELERVIRTFPFDNPHLYESKRKKYMDENYVDDKDEVLGWGEALCGDEEVWKELAIYCIANKESFA